MKLKKILLLFIISLSMFSCVIQQDIVFNKDFSGSYKYSIDFKEYVKFLKAEAGEKNDEENYFSNEDFEEYLNFVKFGLENILGIENLKIVNNAEEGEVYFSYDFADINTLNQALRYSSLDTVTNEYSSYFEKKGKTITYVRPKIPTEENENKEDENNIDFDDNNIFSWVFNLEFATDVKKHNLANDTTISIQKGGRKFTETNNIYDYTNKETKWVFKLK